MIRRIGADNKAALARCGESRHAKPDAHHQGLDGKRIGDAKREQRTEAAGADEMSQA